MTQGNMPGWWRGTEPEWVVFRGLESVGKQHNRDFVFDSTAEDGVAFRFLNPNDLAINVTGLMHNYEAGKDGVSTTLLSKQQMIGLGIYLIFIEDVDLQQDAKYYINEALAYRDHSNMGG